MSAIGSCVAFPWRLPLRWPRRLLGRSNRKLTRTGLLEYHYEKYLYGDTSLFELPESPQLHILATNLSEGCLCSFNRNGLLMMRRQPGKPFRIDRIHIGLATVPMAVTASSAFPGFFPPLELTGADVGASGGEFGRQAYTDGGVFDNLGVRMFRCLERPLLADTPLSRDDFLDFPAVVEALREASQVQRGNTAAPAGADPGGGRQPTGTVAHFPTRRSSGAGQPSLGRLLTARPSQPGPAMATVKKSWCPACGTSCAITSFTASRSSPA